MNPSGSFHGVNAVQLLLTNMEYVGGFQFDIFQLFELSHADTSQQVARCQDNYASRMVCENKELRKEHINDIVLSKSGTWLYPL